MNADAFRHFYAYHFAENRKLWTIVASLPQDQFTQHSNYSMGSVRNQIVHLMSCDEYWFSGLRGEHMPEPHDPTLFDDRDVLRARWTAIEQAMREYLDALHDETLFKHPFSEGADQALTVWQVLLHVGNHGTDHRAQILRLLNDLGVQTAAQDYIFYIFDNL